MTLPREFAVLLRVWLVLQLSQQAAYADGLLGARIEAVITEPPYKHAHWGILVVDIESDETIYENNADKLFAPASTTKLFSVAAALDGLGADYRFETTVLKFGEVDSHGHLHGNLVLVAGGDLTLGGRTNCDGQIVFRNSDHTYANGNDTAELTELNPLAGLNELARQVAESGIKRVRGDVLIDDRLFDKAEGSGSGPSRLTPIVVNDNLLDFIITPGSAGEPATVRFRPETAAYRVDARVETVERDQDTSVRVTSAGNGCVIVRGQISAEHKPLVRVLEVEDAASFARCLFIEALGRCDVVVDASSLSTNRADQLPPLGDSGGQRIAAIQSPAFSESAKLILKVSHNLHASTLPLLLAARHGKRTLADGLRLQHDFLARAGVDVDTISFGGGAGGSRADYTTPRATVQLLRYMATQPDAEFYQAALPILGVDGTLASAVSATSSARGKVHAKTGTLFWENTMNGRHIVTSKALAGYMRSSHGRRLAFAMFVNNTHIERSSDTARIGRTLGRLCEIIYEDQ